MDTITVEYNSIPRTIAYRSRGAGLPIFFIHGWNHSAVVWEPVIDRVLPGYRCIALDLPGFGESAPLASSEISIRSYADLCSKVVSALSGSLEPIGIVGDSFGALVALSMVNRGGVSCRVLVVSGPPADGINTVLRLAGRLRLVWRVLNVLRTLPAKLSHFLIRIFAAPTVRRRPDICETLIPVILKADPSTAQATFEAISHVSDHPIERPVGAAHISVLRGEYDRIVSKATILRLAQHVKAPFTEISGVGHTVMLEAPDTYAGIINALLRTAETDPAQQ